MSQNDMSIANQAFGSFRSDLNAALQAQASKQSGTSVPGTTYAYQEWADTTNSVLKRRNAANSGYIVRDTLDETFVLARSSNTVLGLSDIGKSIIATSTFTQTLTAAATLGDGWWCRYRNDGSGTITIDPNSTEQIDGASTIALAAGESCVIVCNGSAFKTIGRTASPDVGTWTPAISFDTPGNLSVAYTYQLGDYIKIGRLVLLNFNVTTSTFTHTTASGALLLSGLPFAIDVATGNVVAAQLSAFQGITKASYTAFSLIGSDGASNLRGNASGSGQSLVEFSASDVPTGGTVILRGTLVYKSA